MCEKIYDVGARSSFDGGSWWFGTLVSVAKLYWPVATSLLRPKF
jgi:hypothetical protein